MSAPLFAVVNPVAGGGRARAVWRTASQRLQALGLGYEYEVTQGPLAGLSLTRQALRAGAEIVLAVGGDGTIHEVVNGFFLGDGAVRPGARLAIVPAGASSNIARGLGIPDGLAAVDLLSAGQAVSIDLGEATFLENDRPVVRYFVNNAGLGQVPGLRFRVPRSGFRVPVPARSQLATRNPELGTRGARAWAGALAVDESPPREVRCLMAVVALGPYMAGGVQIAPGAKWDDGLLDLVLVEEMPTHPPLSLLGGFAPQALRVGFRALRLRRGWGSAVRSQRSASPQPPTPNPPSLRAQEIRIQTAEAPPIQLDGEVVGTGSAEFRILPQAIEVYVPRP